jgi:hypothetical protein
MSLAYISHISLHIRLTKKYKEKQSMKKLMVIVTVLLFASGVSAQSFHGCGRGYYGGGGYYAPHVCGPVAIYRPAPRYYAPYAYRGCPRGYEHYRGGYYR